MKFLLRHLKIACFSKIIIFSEWPLRKNLLLPNHRIESSLNLIERLFMRLMGRKISLSLYENSFSYCSFVRMYVCPYCYLSFCLFVQQLTLDWLWPKGRRVKGEMVAHFLIDFLQVMLCKVRLFVWKLKTGFWWFILVELIIFKYYKWSWCFKNVYIRRL